MKIEEIIEVIKNGGVVVCPTDTVYGLLADAANEKAVEKVFKIKKRQKTKPFPIFVKDIKTAKKLAYIDTRQEKILKNKWPGKFTFVLNRRPAKIFGVAKKTIVLRVPNYKLIDILLEKLNRPLTGTSANISGQPESTKIEEVLTQFENQKMKPEAVFNAGDLPKSFSSTIIDLTDKTPRIIREGE